MLMVYVIVVACVVVIAVVVLGMCTAKPTQTTEETLQRLGLAEADITRLENQAYSDRQAWVALSARVKTLEELVKAEDEIRAAAATTIRRFLEEPKLKRKAKKA